MSTEFERRVKIYGSVSPGIAALTSLEIMGIEYGKYIDSETENDFLIVGPGKLPEKKIGTCYETSLFIFDVLREYDSVTPHFIFLGSRSSKSHACVIYQKDDLFWWPEYSWYFMRGIHGPFRSWEKITEAVENAYVGVFGNIDYRNCDAYVSEIIKMDFIPCDIFYDTINPEIVTPGIRNYFLDNYPLKESEDEEDA